MSPTVLVIDDSPLIHRMLARYLGDEDCRVRGALGAAEGIAATAREQPDLVLLDLVLRGGSGFEVLRALKRDARTCDIPVIMVSCTREVRDKVRSFDLGAVDYVVKPFDRAELRARVRAALRTKRYHDLLASRSQIDALTGLGNRACFGRRLDEEIAAARRGDRRFSLVLVDVDHFKQVNDTYGHPAGDRLLVGVAEALTATVRGGDTACRPGGDEFALILVGSGRPEAAAAALRVRERVAQLELVAGGVPIQRSISLGAACSDDFAAGELTRERLLEAADRALYAAKQGGRNRVQLADAVHAAAR